MLMVIIVLVFYYKLYHLNPILGASLFSDLLFFFFLGFLSGAGISECLNKIKVIKIQEQQLLTNIE